jgi:hypothetical protein
VFSGPQLKCQFPHDGNAGCSVQAEYGHAMCLYLVGRCAWEELWQTALVVDTGDSSSEIKRERCVIGAHLFAKPECHVGNRKKQPSRTGSN